MKHKFFYLLSLLVVLSAGCIKDSKQAPAPPAPVGKFTGQFIYLHRHTNKVPFDTLKTDITINLQTDFTFTTVPTNTAVHVASNGTYGIISPYLAFTDQTYTTTPLPTITHLNGYYIYNYDGTTLKMLAYSVDTLALEYNLTKAK
jgi:hypothetical protein